MIFYPPYFTLKHRCTTRNSGRVASVEVLRVINEPKADAYAYELQRCVHASRKILIYDFGGRIFDVNTLQIQKGRV